MHCVRLRRLLQDTRYNCKSKEYEKHRLKSWHQHVTPRRRLKMVPVLMYQAPRRVHNGRIQKLWHFTRTSHI